MLESELFLVAPEFGWVPAELVPMEEQAARVTATTEMASSLSMMMVERRLDSDGMEMADATSVLRRVLYTAHASRKRCRPCALSYPKAGSDEANQAR